MVESSLWKRVVVGSNPSTLTKICYTMNMRKDSEYTEKHKQWCKNHYKANKEAYFERNKKRAAEFRTIIAQMKGTTCLDCKREYHQCQLDFDHVKGEKKFNISKIPDIHSKKALLEEIAKCEVVCASCHRLRTFQRSSNSRTAPSEGVNVGANPAL